MATPALSRALVAAHWDAQAEADSDRRGMVPAVLEIRKDFPTAALMRDGQRVGTLSFKVAGDVFYVAFLGAPAGGNIIAEFAPAIYDHARALGCKTIRCTTERAGMVQKLTATQGWSVSAVILEKKL